MPPSPSQLSSIKLPSTQSIQQQQELQASISQIKEEEQCIKHKSSSTEIPTSTLNSNSPLTHVPIQERQSTISRHSDVSTLTSTEFELPNSVLQYAMYVFISYNVFVRNGKN